MNIYTKLSAYSLIGMLLFSSIIFVFVDYTTKTNLEKQVTQNFEEKTDNIINNIDRFIYERMHEISLIANDSIFRIYDLKQSVAQSHLESIKKKNKMILSMSFFKAKPDRLRFADTKHKKINEVHSFSKYWLKFAKNKDVVMDISRSESLGIIVMHFGSKIYDKLGNHIGYVVSRVDIKNLYDVFIDRKSNDHDYLVELIDENGKLLYSDNKFSKLLTKEYDDYSIWKEIKKNKLRFLEKDDDLYFSKKQKGYSSYKGTDWNVVVSINKNVAFKAVNDLRVNLLSIFIPLALVTIGFAIIIARRIAHPIKDLAYTAERIGNGDLEVQSFVSSKDEIGKLAKTLNLMSSRLKRKIEEQESTNKNLTTLNKVILEKNEQFTQSIWYARRIQSALMPKQIQLKEIHESMFVFYRPKDIVSGDFYWIQKLTIENEDHLIVVCADCTGHGVPGAFLSLLGINILNKIVLSEKNYKATEIIHQLEIDFITNLTTNQSRFENNDGMDISICSINLSKNTLEFSSANQNLFLVRDRKVIEVKGMKRGIGEVKMSELDTLTKDNYISEFINYQDNDWIYLSSDGFKDQFGGNQEKKYSKKRFRNLLLELNDFGAGDQRRIMEKDFDDYKGINEQLDDVLVIGLKLEKSEEINASQLENNSTEKEISIEKIL